MKVIHSACLVSLGVVVCAAGCSRHAGAPAGTAAPAPAHAEGGASAGGVAWDVPANWRLEGARPMRVATYDVPAAAGDAEQGECAVYYFGSDQGGDIAANVARWSSQFEGSPAATTSAKQVGGLAVTEVEVAGTYLPQGGPMMQPMGKKPGFRLVGAIVAAPGGSVFFKLTGPGATVAAARSDFDSLIASLTKR